MYIEEQQAFQSSDGVMANSLGSEGGLKPLGRRPIARSCARRESQKMQRKMLNMKRKGPIDKGEVSAKLRDTVTFVLVLT